MLLHFVVDRCAYSDARDAHHGRRRVSMGVGDHRGGQTMQAAEKIPQPVDAATRVRVAKRRVHELLLELAAAKQELRAALESLCDEASATCDEDARTLRPGRSVA